MGDFPGVLRIPASGVMHTGSTACCLGGPTAVRAAVWNTAVIWPSANLACYIPFLVEVPVIAYLMGWQNGATVAGNIDVGIYNSTLKRLVSSTPVAMTGVSVIQTVDITDTALSPGLYYMAMASDSATATFNAVNSMTVQWLQVCGMQQQASAATLPDPAVFANPTFAYLPGLSIAFKAAL